MRVLRDVTLRISIGGDKGSTMMEPVKVIYTMTMEGDKLKVQSIKAYWSAFRQYPAEGESRLKNIAAALGVFYRLLKIQGFWWCCQYTVGLFRGPWDFRSLEDFAPMK